MAVTTVVFGNPRPIEAWLDDSGPEPVMRWREMGAPTVGRIKVPSDDLDGVRDTVLLALPRLVAEGHNPTWVATDDGNLTRSLAAALGVKPNDVPEEHQLWRR